MKPEIRPAPAPKSETPERKKRFRVERLEERLAPRGHYNPRSKWVGNGDEPVFTSIF